MRRPPFLYRFSVTIFYVLAHVAFDWKTRLGSGTKWCACSNEDLLTMALVSPTVAFTFLVAASSYPYLLESRVTKKLKDREQ